MSLLAFLYEELRKKQEELKRLQTCQASLQECQEEFLLNEPLCLEPKLSAHTWHGNLARKFDLIREEEILSNYRNLENNQLNQAFSTLSNKIQDVQNEIAALEVAIQNEIARMRAESERRQNHE
ncbi:DUF5082 family protein [Cytobacillus sp. Hz8]|uniref:YwqH-like family protein n=1 Tax=Cytobacillus sp. Hz8 TaxID=3347168 RepID=UPI0035E3B961